MLMDSNHWLPPCKYTCERVLWQALTGRVRLSKIPRQTKRATTDGESEVEVEADEPDLPLKSPGARQFRTHLMTPRKWKSQVLLTSWKP